MGAPSSVISRIPRVAVVAVHGVADQQANESNRAVASLLLERSGALATYGPWTTRELHLAQHPVMGRASGAVAAHANDERDTLFRLEERREYLATPQDGSETVADAEGDLGYRFMTMQLDGHEPPGSDERTYVTTVLGGVRRNASGVTTHDVDVHEVYWADLSRPGSGTFAFFGTAYQLLLHIATLGRQAVDDATTELPGPWWRATASVQRWAVRGLTLLLPLLNVQLLVVGLGVVPAQFLLQHASRAVAAVAGVAMLAGVALAFAVRGSRTDDSPLRWAARPVLNAALGGAIVLALVRPGLVSPMIAVMLAWWAIGGIAMWYVGSRYQRLRAGATITSLTLHVSAALYFWTVMWTSHGPALSMIGEAERATLWTMQAIFAAQRAVWIVVIVCAVLLVCLWFPARHEARTDPSAWSRGRAALRTGRLTLALAASSFLVLTICAWAGLYAFGMAKLGAFSALPAATAAPLGVFAGFVPQPHTVAALRDLATGTVGPTTASPAEYFQGLLAESVTGGAPLSLACVSVALLLLLWMALPSVNAESVIRRECTNVESERMGAWLTRGLDATRWVTHLLFVSAFVVPLAAGTLWSLRDPEGALTGLVARSYALSYTLMGTVGSLLAVSAVVVVGVLVSVGGSALDIVLDVDNYLRTTPATATPRARITQRYVAVLRHLASADERGEARYDGVVIVAHSLGALISVELLRFLWRRQEERMGDPALGRLGFGAARGGAALPIVLLTMGNPLRQLLTRFFPHRYRWVRTTPDNGATSTPAPSGRPDVLDGSHPDGSRLGVVRWENLYRSGDYVGRAIWADEWYRRTRTGDDGGGVDEGITMVPSVRGDADYCIGAGAHTHYWDMNAPDVADRIDAAIAAVTALP